MNQPQIEASNVKHGYIGLDKVERNLEISFSKTPSSINENTAEFKLQLAPKESFSLYNKMGSFNNTEIIPSADNSARICLRCKTYGITDVRSHG